MILANIFEITEIIKFLFTAAIIGGIIYFVFKLLNKKSGLTNIEHDYPPVKTIPTIQEQKMENDAFMIAYDTKEIIDDILPKENLNWNNQNTLESMKLKPCLKDRLTCYTAPTWWYPNDKYDPEKFRSIYYGDYYNPIDNYLGNAQEMYWDFKSVKNS